MSDTLTELEKLLEELVHVDKANMSNINTLQGNIKTAMDCILKTVELLRVAALRINALEARIDTLEGKKVKVH